MSTWFRCGLSGSWVSEWLAGASWMFVLLLLLVSVFSLCSRCRLLCIREWLGGLMNGNLLTGFSWVLVTRRTMSVRPACRTLGLANLGWLVQLLVEQSWT